MPFLRKHSGNDGGNDELTSDEIIEHLKSIEAIPTTLLPDASAARTALMLLCAAGFDCYAYASGGETYGTWCVWITEVARVRDDKNGRVPVTVWAEQWRELLAEAVKGRFTGKDDDETDGAVPDYLQRLAGRLDTALPLEDDDDDDDDGPEGGAA